MNKSILLLTICVNIIATNTLTPVSNDHVVKQLEHVEYILKALDIFPQCKIETVKKTETVRMTCKALEKDLEARIVINTKKPSFSGRIYKSKYTYRFSKDAHCGIEDTKIPDRLDLEIAQFTQAVINATSNHASTCYCIHSSRIQDLHNEILNSNFFKDNHGTVEEKNGNAQDMTKEGIIKDYCIGEIHATLIFNRQDKVLIGYIKKVEESTSHPDQTLTHVTELYEIRDPEPTKKSLDQFKEALSYYVQQLNQKESHE